MYYYVLVEIPRRKQFIERLIKKGFYISGHFNRKDVEEWGLPIIVDFDYNQIRILNVTCSIWARAKGMLRTEEEFWKLIGDDTQ